MQRSRQEEIFPLIESVQKGELTREEFCELTDLKMSSYQYWARKYRDSRLAKGSFVEVVPDKEGGYSGMELHLPGGAYIRFDDLAPSAYIKSLLDCWV